MKGRTPTLRLLPYAAALVLIGSLGLMACGGGSDAGDSDAEPSVTAASPVAATPTAAATEPVSTPTVISDTPAAQPSATIPASQPTLPAPAATSTSAAPPPPPPPQGQTISVLAQSGKFNPARITASANVPLTIVLDNVDAEIAHDIRFSRDGATIASSDVVIGPGQASVTFTPTAGTYKISCSVHPRTMGGTLTVQ